MKRLTKHQYQTIFIYSKGLTFKEMDNSLQINSKAYYTQALYKDKGRITRAKLSREKNKKSYQKELSIYLNEVRCRNKNYSQLLKDKYTIGFASAKEGFRLTYLNDCINKAYSSYIKYKITFIKKYLEKVA